MAMTKQALDESGTTPSEPIVIKTTQDGRQVTVIGQAIYLGQAKEADTLVPVAQHPNREAILRAVPDATHMAGRLPLSAKEAERAFAALLAAKRAYENSPAGLAERVRLAPKQILRLRAEE